MLLIKKVNTTLHALNIVFHKNNQIKIFTKSTVIKYGIYLI